MRVDSVKNIETLVCEDQWMMDVLMAAKTLDLPDWWIGAGFLRNKVWDALEGNITQKSRDVDLVYFDRDHTAPETDWAYDEKMNTEYPFAEWEVRNQARMHYKNGFEPFHSTADGISHWVETATCVAVRLKGDSLEFLFCHGSQDLLEMVARPVSYFQSAERIHTFHERVDQKKWRERWPKLKVVDS